MEKKMKILIANETYPPNLNGCAMFTQRLAQNLAKEGHDVAVIAPAAKFGDEIEVDKYGVRVYRLRSIPIKMIHPNFRVITKPDIYPAIKKIMLEFEPDIVHIQNHFSLGKACIKAAKKLDIPVMGTNHFMPDNLVQFVPGFIRSTAVKVMWKDFLKVYNKLDYVTAPSKAAVDMLYDVGYKKEAAIISNGIEVDKFKKRPVSDKLLKKYRLSKNISTFISVGRIEKDKNLDLVLEAFSLFTKKKKGQLILVGVGKNEKEFKRLAKLLKLGNKVVFTGKISDEELEEIHSLADVYVGAGTAELQGIAVMEGMASGLPVLAVNAVALPELVEHGANGYLFELEVKDLADKMLEIVEDEERLKKMAKRSLEIISKHDKAETIKQFEKVYEEVIAKKKGRVPVAVS